MTEIPGPSQADRQLIPLKESIDEIQDPFARSIRSIFETLGIERKPIRDGLTEGNRFIRNAGMRIAQLYLRTYYNEEFIKSLSGEDEGLIGLVEAVQVVQSIFKESQNEDEIYKEAIRHIQAQKIKQEGARKNRKYFNSLLNGKAGKRDVVDFIEKARREIPLSLSIKSGFIENLQSDAQLTVEGLICLSVLHKDEQPNITNKALGYIRDNDKVAQAILDNFGDHFYHLSNGIRDHILHQELKGFTPL